MAKKIPAKKPSLASRAAKIRLLLMDVDGVLTDGKLYYIPGHDGEMVETKGFDSQDGVGFFMLNDAGIKTGVISGRISPATVERARIVKMSYVYQGHLEKEASFNEILSQAKLQADQVAYIGDDFTDVVLMKKVGISFAVANARPEVRKIADLVTKAAGGQGALREVAEILLKNQKGWQAALKRYELA